LLSGILWLRALWPEPGIQGGVYIFIFCFLAILLEALQYLHAIPGTFDAADILTMLVTAFGESLWYTQFIHRRIRYAR
ncbi:MAG: hypothetical protein LBB68_06255, partial [Treponema sp.]|nr:hypothetical protein [Treponema sp.]